MDNLEKKVFETIQKYNLIQRGDRIVVAVSGGPDSICLLDILNKIKNKNCQLNPEPVAINCQTNPEPMAIFVAHVNHMIRKEACEDEAFVRDYCEKNGIEFFSKSIDVEKFANNNKMGTEEAGRFVRYEFFDEVAKKVGANKIAIAHNKNDSAETIIMNILRGTGVSGLKGIEPIKNNKYIRPLINCKREEIENYCEKNSLNPRIDKTNFENIGGSYSQQGDYLLPTLTLPDENQRQISVWAMRHRRYLKSSHRVLYYNLLTSGKLYNYLADVELQAENLFEQTIKSLAEQEQVTEKLKAENMMLWVQKMNNIRNRATEIVNEQVIYK